MSKFTFLFTLILFENLIFAKNSFDFLYATEEDKKLFYGKTDVRGNVVLCGSIGDRYGNKDALVMIVFLDGTYITNEYRVVNF